VSNAFSSQVLDHRLVHPAPLHEVGACSSDGAAVDLGDRI
jgi:hypothetical protein